MKASLLISMIKTNPRFNIKCIHSYRTYIVKLIRDYNIKAYDLIYGAFKSRDNFVTGVLKVSFIQKNQKLFSAAFEAHNRLCQFILNEEPQYLHPGKLVFQTERFTDEQMSKISSSEHKVLIAFGDNDTDNTRSFIYQRRRHFGGQARIVGHYDDRFAVGIVTIHFESKPSAREMKRIWDQQFGLLEQHMIEGYDVVFPVPSQADLAKNKHIYCDNKGKQIIYHNLGTGIANLSREYLLYIQGKIIYYECHTMVSFGTFCFP